MLSTTHVSQPTPHGFDPRREGCHCDSCPLGPNGFLRDQTVPWTPVPDEFHAEDIAVAVAENPSTEEVKLGFPFAGKSGQEWNATLHAIGRRREHVAIVSTISCQPPGESGGAYKRMEREIKRENARLKALAKIEGAVTETVHQWPTPAQCCLPRLQKGLQRFSNIITLGGSAAKAVFKTQQGVLAIRGGPIELPTSDPAVVRKCMPTLHPAFVLRAMQWRDVFQADLAKAFRWFENKRTWFEPHYEWYPTPARLREWLAQPARFVVYDYEASGKDPLTARVDCIGFARLVEPPRTQRCEKCQGSGLRVLAFSPGNGWIPAGPDCQHLPCTCCDGKGVRTIDVDTLLVPIESREDRSRHFYNQPDEEEVKQTLREWFARPSAWKVGHNCLFSGTPVLLADGTSRPIDELVRQRYAGKVKAVDAAGRITAATVTGWFQSKDEDARWLVIRRDGEKKHARGLTLTADHEVYTQRGRVRAEHVQPGDRILTEEPELTEDQTQAIIGTLLGDSIATAGTTRSAAYGSQHIKVDARSAVAADLVGGHVDAALVAQKNMWLGGLLSVSARAITGGYSKAGGTFYSYRTARMRQIADISRKLFPDGRLQVTRAVLDAMGPVGWAWLFADDGFRHKREERKAEACLIGTCSFDDASLETTRAWLADKFGACTLTAERSVRLSVAASGRFAAWIAPYLLPAARYKLPRGSGELADFSGYPSRDPRALGVRVESVTVFEPSTATSQHRRKATTRWCVQTTEGNFLTAFGAVKNCSGYDDQLTEAWLGVRPWPEIDTLPLARARAPDLPKGLGPLGSILSDVFAWKADKDGVKIAFHASSDPQLHYYCITDCAVNAKILDPLYKIATEKGYFRPLPPALKPVSWPTYHPWTLSGVDAYRQEMCRHFHRAGLYVDQVKRQKHEARLDVEAAKYKFAARKYAHALGVTGKVTASAKTGDVSKIEMFNPGSRLQIAQIFFKEWGLIPTKFSEETGEASVDDEVMRGILTDGTVDGDRKAFVDAIRRYNRARKAKATFCVPLRMQRTDPEYGLVWDDGRMHNFTSSIITSVARLNSSGVNLQNVPVRFRDQYAAQPIYDISDSRYPGRIMIGGDVDQFHLRIIANRWRVGRLLEGFKNGVDPHCALAYDFFGSKFKHASGWGPNGFSLLQKDKPKKDSDADKMRSMAKVIRYQGAYADIAEGIWRSVVKVENKDTGDMPFAHMTVREVTKLYNIWMRNEPEWERAWNKVMNTFTANGGWIEEAVFGRRSGGLDNGKLQAVVNYDILAEEAPLFSLIECNLRTAFPENFEGAGTGLVSQTHDAANGEMLGAAWEEDRGGKVVVACDTQTERRRQLWEECMTIPSGTLPGWEVAITAEAKVGPVRRVDGTKCLSNWKEA